MCLKRYLSQIRIQNPVKHLRSETLPQSVLYLVEIFKSTFFTEHVRTTVSTSQCNSAKYEFENSQENTYARVSFLLNFYLLK